MAPGNLSEFQRFVCTLHVLTAMAPFIFSFISQLCLLTHLSFMAFLGRQISKIRRSYRASRIPEHLARQISEIPDLKKNFDTSSGSTSGDLGQKNLCEIGPRLLLMTIGM